MDLTRRLLEQRGRADRGDAPGIDPGRQTLTEQLMSGSAGAGSLALGTSEAAWDSVIPAVDPAVAANLGLTPFDPGGGALQLAADGNAPAPESTDAHAIAARGVAGAGAPLPHLDRIQAAFGHHDISAIRAHTDGAAQAASTALGARAYATGTSVAFREAPSVFLAAHEAAHVVQQRGGVQLSGGVGAAHDVHEQHADAVAERVVRGESAEALLDRYAGGASTVSVQRSPAPNESTGSESQTSSPDELRAWLTQVVRLEPQPAASCINVFAGSSVFARIHPTGEPEAEDQFRVEIVERGGQPVVELHLDAPGRVEASDIRRRESHVPVRVVGRGRPPRPRPPQPAPAPARQERERPPWWVLIPFAGLAWRPVREATREALTERLPEGAAHAARTSADVLYEHLPELLAGVTIPILGGFRIALAPESFVSVIHGKADTLQRLGTATTREERWNILLTYAATETLGLIASRIQSGLTPLRGTIRTAGGAAAWVSSNATALKGRLLLALFESGGQAAIEALREGGLDLGNWQQFGSRITRGMANAVASEALEAIGVPSGAADFDELASGVVSELLRRYIDSGIEAAQAGS